MFDVMKYWVICDFSVVIIKREHQNCFGIQCSHAFAKIKPRNKRDESLFLHDVNDDSIAFVSLAKETELMSVSKIVK